MKPTLLLCAVAMVLVSHDAHAAQWRVDAAKSRLGFVVTWDREPFRADFKRWTANIDFDPANLQAGKADVVIDIASFVSEDPENDKYRLGPNGLDVRRFGQARFASKSFRETGAGRYEAVADLTIHGVTKEVRLPFALAINGNAAHMTGELTLSRVDFGVGTGSTWGIDWSSQRTVAHAVKVTVDLMATRTP
jgi:polyisoprenoid-binding protein YceI